MVSDLAYIGSIFLALSLYAVGGWILWQGVELVYFIYCKATGRKY